MLDEQRHSHNNRDGNIFQKNTEDVVTMSFDLTPGGHRVQVTLIIRYTIADLTVKFILANWHENC